MTGAKVQSQGAGTEHKTKKRQEEGVIAAIGLFRVDRDEKLHFQTRHSWTSNSAAVLKYAIGSITANMTSSTKPEVHNVSQRRQTRTEPRPRGICTKMVKIGPAVPEIC